MIKNKLPVRFTGQHFTIDKVLIADAIKIAKINERPSEINVVLLEINNTFIGFKKGNSEMTLTISNDNVIKNKTTQKANKNSQTYNINFG